MEFDKIIQLIEKVSESDLTGFVYEEGNIRINLMKGENGMMPPIMHGPGMPPGGPHRGEYGRSMPQMVRPDGDASEFGMQEFKTDENAVDVTPAEKIIKDTSAKSEGKIVKSPLVGIFYVAPSEDADPFVSVGDTVKKGQTLAIVEAMKLMNEIESEYDGTVVEVLAENGQAVEYGQPLFRIG